MSVHVTLAIFVFIESGMSSMSRPIATCVLGVGLSGLAFHIPFILALKELFTLHSVLERNPTQEGGSVKQRFGVSIRIHRSFEAVIADPEIELVIIGTPNDTHYDFAKASLLAGKHGNPRLRMFISCWRSFSFSSCRQTCHSNG